jgi:outer membrane protein TolC
MNAVRWIRLGFICLAAWMMLSAGVARAEQLSLDKCIEIALDRNVSLASARYSLDLARQNVWGAYGSWLPQFSLSASYSYYEQGGVSQYQFTSPISRTYSKSINVQQNLFRWGGNYFNLKYYLNIRNAGEHNLTQSELETIDLVKNYYFSALKYLGLLEVAEQAVGTAEHNLELVQARYDLGSANQSELLKAKVQLLSNKSSLEAAKKNRAVSMAQLNNVMNRPATARLELDDRVDTLTVAEDYQSAMAYAERNHPSILSADAELQATRYQRLYARSSYLPSVSWNASRSYSAGDVGDWGSFDDEYANWYMGVNFSWPIPFFDGFSRKTTHSRATAAYNLAELTMESTINGVGLDIQTALLSINNARANLYLYEESLHSAEKDLEIAQERYNLGAATVLDLLDAEKNLADARNSFVSAKFDFNLAVSALDKAMGRRR